MPIISMFYGLVISLYFADNKQHHLPHIHISFGEYEAVYEIPTGNLIDGFLPMKKHKLILAWIEIHQENLMANWNLAIEGLPIFKIEPLK
jgi:hypothetical protein